MFQLLSLFSALIGYALTFCTNESIWDSCNPSGSYFNTIKTFLASCPSYTCWFSTQAAQCHYDAVDVFVVIDDKMWASIDSKALPSVDICLQGTQASYLNPPRVNFGTGPVDISFVIILPKKFLVVPNHP